MTVEEGNVEVLRKGYALWSDSKAQSAEEWLNLMAEDVQWRSLGDGAAGAEFSKACRSKEEVRSYFEQLTGEWKLISYRVDEYIAQGDRVVMLGSCEWESKVNGKRVKTPKADVFRLREGKIVDFMEYYDTAQVVAAAA